MSRPSAIVIAAAVCGFAGGALAQEIDFKRDIEPIFSAHCISCHGKDRAEGGLSLHSYEAALERGDSRRPILFAKPETNEILRRVKSEDPDKRMPLEADALSQAEIQLLERWVEHGTPWPSTQTQGVDFGHEGLNLLIERWITPYLFWLGGLLVAILVVERLKAVGRKRDAGKGGLLGRCYAGARRVGVPIYLIAGLCIALGILIDQTFLLEHKLDKALAAPVPNYRPASITELFGDPPVPIHMGHEPRLGGTYYRGNNERRSELYNNGNYRTATFDLSLVDEQGNTLDYDAKVDGQLRIHLVIHRAPGATPLLFTEDIMSGLLLATGYHPGGVKVPGDRAVTFASAQTPDAWEVYFPVELAGAGGSGLVYLYRGDREDDGSIQTSGMPQLGIVYDLKLEDGRIAAGSELWMNAIYFPEDVAPPTPRGMLPWTQWFDYRPIQTIEGDNSQDPEELGITAEDGAPQTRDAAE